MFLFDNVHHYDNCLVFIDKEWSTSEVAGLRARFADGPFELSYDGIVVEFIKHFKERFKSFYEKVLRDYDEVLGYDKPTYEDCFDAMVADMTLIDYKPERTIDIDFKIPKAGQVCYDNIGGHYFYVQAETMKKVNAAFNKSLQESQVVALEDILRQIADEWHKEAK